MTRVKRGATANKKRAKILKQTKGFRWRRKTNERAAKEALVHAWDHAFRGRKQRKRDFRSLWQVRISALSKENGVSYSKFIAGLKKNNIALNRKMLSDLAQNNEGIFKKLVDTASK